MKVLIEKAFSLIEAEHTKVIPMDLLVRRYLDYHTQYKYLVYEKFA